MNIFATDPSAIKCAEYLDDKRVVKMVLETAQLLATSINLNGGKATYKSTHINHPCAIWARKSQANYLWLLMHFNALLVEYANRFGKRHKCADYFDEFKDGFKLIPKGERTLHPNCTIFKEEQDVYKAYRMYMEHKWKNDKIQPRWYKDPEGYLRFNEEL